MINKTYYQIEGHDGRWLHVDTTISELGFIMAKFHSEEKGVWMTVNMGSLERALGIPWRTRPEQLIESVPEGTGITQTTSYVKTRFLQSVQEICINDKIYYLDDNGQYYRMVEMDEDFDFIDDDDPEFAYVWVADPYAEEEDED